LAYDLSIYRFEFLLCELLTALQPDFICYTVKKRLFWIQN
jgi:hypothetical protein